MPQPTPSDLAEVRQYIRDVLQEEIKGSALGGVIERVLDAVDAGGQKPSFCLLPIWVCEAAGGDPCQAVGLAAAWHLLYVAAMLLDDVEDDELSLKQWPSMTTGHAANIATTLIFASQLALSRLDRVGVDVLRIRSLQETYNRTILKMCAGQHSDLMNISTALDDHWQVVAAKSGVFFSLACRAGAMLVTDDTATVEAYAGFGLHLGILVQIGDDLQGVWHPLGPMDLSSGSKTLPVVYALSVVAEQERAHLYDLLARAVGDASVAAEAQRLLVEAGAIEYLLAAAEIHREHARAALPAAENEAGRARLISFLDEIAPVPNLHS